MPVVTRHSRVRWLLAALVAGAAAQAMAAPQDVRTLCAPDAAGAMRVLVLMPPQEWPAGGFEVRRGKASLGHVAADAQALAALEPGEAQALARLPGRARAAGSAGASMIVYARLLSDWDFARASGMGGVLPGAGAGKGDLTLQPLNASGAPAGHAMRCQPRGTEPPPAPAGLHAAMRGEGPSLYWNPLAAKPPVPVLSFRVWRRDGGQETALIEHAPFLPPTRRSDDAAYIDTLAPLEQTVVYEVALVDALGRAGRRAQVSVYTSDLDALRPPAKLQVEVRGPGIALSWTAGGNPHTAGYVVERAFLATGPYLLLTPGGLHADTPQYTDNDVSVGTAYYYRVRAMGPRGDLGPPSDPVVAQPRSERAPPAPGDVVAEVGDTRVRLHWSPLPSEVAGYIVERRAEGSPAWSRINQELWPATRYDDPLGPQAGGVLYYRVTAVTQDNVESPPSKLVRVQLHDTVPPLPPRIVAASGSDGRVRLEVRAARPASDTARIYVLRGGSADAEGLVIGAPLQGSATTYEDSWVKPGQTYWYHLVAYDAAGNRSSDSDAVAIRVGAPPMPAPDAPKARFESSPLPRVVLDFAAPPKRLAVLVQRSFDGVHWQGVAGPTTTAGAQDLDPGSAPARYRIRYLAADGSIGPASPNVEVPHG